MKDDIISCLKLEMLMQKQLKNCIEKLEQSSVDEQKIPEFSLTLLANYILRHLAYMPIERTQIDFHTDQLWDQRKLISWASTEVKHFFTIKSNQRFPENIYLFLKNVEKTPGIRQENLDKMVHQLDQIRGSIKHFKASLLFHDTNINTGRTLIQSSILDLVSEVEKSPEPVKSRIVPFSLVLALQNEQSLFNTKKFSTFKGLYSSKRRSNFKYSVSVLESFYKVLNQEFWRKSFPEENIVYHNRKLCEALTKGDTSNLQKVYRPVNKSARLYYLIAQHDLLLAYYQKCKEIEEFHIMNLLEYSMHLRRKMIFLYVDSVAYPLLSNHKHSFNYLPYLTQFHNEEYFFLHLDFLYTGFYKKYTHLLPDKPDFPKYLHSKIGSKTNETSIEYQNTETTIPLSKSLLNNLDLLFFSNCFSISNIDRYDRYIARLDHTLNPDMTELQKTRNLKQLKIMLQEKEHSMVVHKPIYKLGIGPYYDYSDDQKTKQKNYFWSNNVEALLLQDMNLKNSPKSKATAELYRLQKEPSLFMQWINLPRENRPPKLLRYLPYEYYANTKFLA